MKNQSSITVINKTRTIILCCLISFAISGIVTILGKINVHDFIENIYDWQNM